MNILFANSTGMFNPLMGTGNYSATSNNMKLVHWPLMSACAVTFGTARRGLGPPRPLILAVPKQPAHQRPEYKSSYCCIMVRCCAVLMCPLKG